MRSALSHAVLFSYDPLFRAYEESGEHLFANAVLYPVTGGAPAAALNLAPVNLASRFGRAEAERAQGASQVAGVYRSTWRPITIEVSASDLARTKAIVSRYTRHARIDRVGGSVFFLIPNHRGLDAEMHPFASDLVLALQRADIKLLSLSL